MRSTGSNTASSTTVENAAWTMPIESVARELSVDIHSGLSSEEAARRQRQFGLNELLEQPPIPLWKKFLRQFRELMVWLLMAAAIVAGIIGDWTDTVAIITILVLNSVVSLIQEEKSGRALAALRKLSPPAAKTIRDGQRCSLPARELAPGDIVQLEAGDNIPADARLMTAYRLQTDESALTGESLPVEKNSHLVLSADTALADRNNMLFLGTTVVAGEASALVVATGMHTQLGRIAGMLERFNPAPTPLERRVTALGKVLIIICLAIVVLISVLQLLRGGQLLEVLIISISLAVAAVPEGMPAVVTLTLALGLQRMVRRNAIIRRLASVETLGSVTTICSDKTGTLTRNEMTAREIVAGDRHYQVTGVGYSPHGQFLRVNRMLRALEDQAGEFSAIDPAQAADLRQVLLVGGICNHSDVRPAGDGSGQWHALGDPTEAALTVAARKAGIDTLQQRERIVFEVPFDSQRKSMFVVVEQPDGSQTLYAKGAPEVVIAKCTWLARDGQCVPLTEECREHLFQQNSEMARRALRVLALAYKPLDNGAPHYDDEGLIFAGLIGMMDPPREEAHTAVRKCFEAGIRPIMITGDHPHTAMAIANELQIAQSGAAALTGRELDALSDDELASRLRQTSVFARVAPEHKLRIVRTLQTQNEIVAMTGDGVNDAPAVKAADVGIAMGLTGSDVTKEAADMVLADNNFASIVNAVEEGRTIFDNIQKFVRYLLACNAGEVLLMFFAALVDWPVPLTAIQLLWINLITDGLPALALGAENPERDIMRRKPRELNTPVVSLPQGVKILIEGALIAGVAVLGFWITYRGSPERLAVARTVAFCVVAYTQIFFSIACRSERTSMPQLGVASNRFLLWAIVVSGLLQFAAVAMPFSQVWLKTTDASASQWFVILLLSLVPVTIVEIAKVLRGLLKRPAI